MLEKHLQAIWNRSNHAKYRHYFKVWFDNLTEIQLEWYKEKFNG